MEMKLYDKIFDVANTKMQEHGMQFGYGKEVFSSILYKNPAIIYVDEFANMDFKNFVDVLYLRCLNRLPDAVAYEMVERFSHHFWIDVPLGKYIMLMNISNSEEFKGMDKKLIGLEEMRQELLKNGSFKTRLLLKRTEFMIKTKWGVKQYFVFPIWKRMPNGIKNGIRGLMKREKK